MDLIKININLPPKELKEFCENNDNWLLQLPNSISHSEIKHLYDTHKNSRYCSGLLLGAIAEHLLTPINILEQISESADWAILASLATNPNINDKIITELIKTRDYSVLEHLVYNKVMTQSHLINLLKITIDTDLKEIIKKILSDRDKPQLNLGSSHKLVHRNNLK